MPPALSVEAALSARGIGLRPETPEDRPFLRDLYGAVRAEELARASWPEAFKRHFLDDQFRLQHHHFTANCADAERMIVLRDEAAIGRLYVDRGDAWWRLLEISLVPSAQGHGLGAALIGSLMARATAAGAAGIDLHVAWDNVRAEALYRRLGFAASAAPAAAASHRRLAWRPIS